MGRRNRCAHERRLNMLATLRAEISETFGCGRPPHPHHLRFTQSRALGRKVSDEFTVPLCRGHHREVHRYAMKPGGRGRWE
jgi:hypothetical protein